MEVPRRRLELQENDELISPPIIVEPLYRCSPVVNVRGYKTHATLDVEVDGSVVVSNEPGGFPQPHGAILKLPTPLDTGQVVRARQHSGGVTSDWSAPATVRDHTQDYPAGPPRPEINPAPVYQCGLRTGVSNLLVGCNVWITADGAEVGRVDGAAAHQGVNVNPAYELGDEVLAFAELCADPSPASELHIAQAPPSPMPTPAFEPIYEGGEQLTITNLSNGARFTLTRGGANQGTWRTWGQRHHVGLNPPFSAGEVFSVTQLLCPGDPSSPPGSGTAQPCSSLPAPGVAPVQVGDMQVVLTSFVPDATVKVYINLVKVGEGSGPVVGFPQAVQSGDTIHVVQDLARCLGQTAQELSAQCVAPPLDGDPSALNLFPVGFAEYSGADVTVFGNKTHPVRGTVYYPADSDGDNTPFNSRLAAVGLAPVVFMVHGRHSASDPSHLGYDYFQKQLARMGVVAVSVDMNLSNTWDGWTDNIRQRAEIMVASIAYWQSLNAGGSPIFNGKLDFGRTALMGHSRGGEAVVVVPEIITLPGVSIRGVISLAPVDAGASSGRPTGYAFMTILPAADGDVIENSGARFYDRAVPDPFRCQLYVHHANHNFFNRRWLNDDTNGGLPLMSRSSHERILSAYGCAFFRAVLLGHPALGFLSGALLPWGVETGNVYISFAQAEATDVDHHDDANGIGQNSLGAPTAQSGGLSADEHPFTRGAPSRFNDSFFGNTTGMVATSSETTGTFRSELRDPVDLSDREIWIRSAEVYNGRSIPSGATGFELGLEDASGSVAWVDVNAAGGLPRPFERRAFDLADSGIDHTKTMPKTCRFQGSCFAPPRSRFRLDKVRAVLLRLNRGDRRAIAFDDLQIV